MEPNPLAIYLLCLGAAALLVFVLWLNHRLRVPPKSEAPAQARAGALEIVLSYILGGAGPVNDYGDDEEELMSDARRGASHFAPSSLRTDDGRTMDGQHDRRPKAEELLTLYQLMRRRGITRDEATAAFKASGLPFNNGVWAQAAPPPEAPAEHAPISGRPLPPGAKFHDDPELEYQPLR